MSYGSFTESQHLLRALGQKELKMTKETQTVQNVLPESGLVRISQILGDKKKGIAPIIPVSKSAWWAGVKAGRYPASVKLGERTTCWRVEDIRALIQAAAV
jgi:predicted DNA-binding transcriptional regulator AlpA